MMDSLKTLQEAQDWVIDRFYDGVTCPCCEQFVKVYRRKITSVCAFGLVVLMKTDPYGFVHMPSFWHKIRLEPMFGAAFNGGDWAKLRFWGVIMPMESTTGAERTGFWRLTQTGRNFVNGAIVLPKYKFFYNGEVLEEGDEVVDIREALGSNFNYDEIMGRL